MLLLSDLREKIHIRIGSEDAPDLLDVRPKPRRPPTQLLFSLILLLLLILLGFLLAPASAPPSSSGSSPSLRRLRLFLLSLLIFGEWRRVDISRVADRSAPSGQKTSRFRRSHGFHYRTSVVDVTYGGLTTGSHGYLGCGTVPTHTILHIAHQCIFTDIYTHTLLLNSYDDATHHYRGYTRTQKHAPHTRVT